MRHLSSSTVFAAAAVLAACGGTDKVTTRSTTEPARTSYVNTPSGPEQQVEPEPRLAGQDDCLFEIEGATVESQPLDDGIAIVFSTDPDHVADVRIKARRLAGGGAAEPTDRGGPLLAGDIHPMTVGTIAVTATVTDTVDGARIELRPVDGLQLAELRRHARAEVVAMASGSCPTVGPSGLGG